MRESLTPITLAFPKQLQRLLDDSCWPEKLIMECWEAVNIPAAKATVHLFECTQIEQILHTCDDACGEWGHASQDLFPYEIRVASAAIQWLGTTNGMYFLNQRVIPLCRMYGTGDDARHMIRHAFVREHHRHISGKGMLRGDCAFIAGSIHGYEEYGAPSREQQIGGSISGRDIEIFRSTIAWLGTDDGSGMVHAFLREYEKEKRNRRAAAWPLV